MSRFIFVMLVLVALVGCSATQAYKCIHRPGPTYEKTQAMHWPPDSLGFALVNKDKISYLTYRGHSDAQLFQSPYGTSITLIFPCIYMERAGRNKYLSVTFEPTGDNGWIQSNRMEAEPLCL